MKPRTALCLRVLEERGSLTSMEALHAGCGSRLAARIKELRDIYGDSAIPDEWESDGDARWKRYHWRPQVQTDLFAEAVAR